MESEVQALTPTSCVVLTKYMSSLSFSFCIYIKELMISTP